MRAAADCWGESQASIEATHDSVDELVRPICPSGKAVPALVATTSSPLLTSSVGPPARPARVTPSAAKTSPRWATVSVTGPAIPTRRTVRPVAGLPPGSRSRTGCSSVFERGDEVLPGRVSPAQTFGIERVGEVAENGEGVEPWRSWRARDHGQFRRCRVTSCELHRCYAKRLLSGRRCQRSHPWLFDETKRDHRVAESQPGVQRRRA